MGRYLALLLPFLLSSKEIVTLYAVDRRTGEVLIDERGDFGMTPASCMKVLTTGAALHLLGEETRFLTTLEYDGEIINNSLHGNLYIRGGGDPSLGAKDWQKDLNTWVDAVKELGIHEVKGKVIADASAWETALAPPGWGWEDLGNYYGAGASALSFHENTFFLTLKPTDIGERVILSSTYPLQFDLVFRNELITGPVNSGDRASIFGSEYSNIAYLRGSIPAGVEEFQIKGAIFDPPTYLEKLFSKTLQDMGIPIHGRPITPSHRTVFHKIFSPTIAEIVLETNNRSMNLYAEHLLKAIGGGSRASGVKALRTFWENLNVDFSDAQISDGSGLSRTNSLSAKQFVAVLQKLEQSPHFSTFFKSLPEVEGMKVKSGTMSLVKGYVGYSEKLIFAFFIGQCPDPSTKKKVVDQCFQRLKIP